MLATTLSAFTTVVQRLVIEWQPYRPDLDAYSCEFL